MIERFDDYVAATSKSSFPAGIYACGDYTSAMRSIATAVASGNLAGASINKVLSELYLLEAMGVRTGCNT